MTVYLCIAGWLLCAVVSSGIWFADFQGSFPRLAEEERRNDMGMAIFYGLVSGPIGMLVGFLLSGFCKHGWRFWGRKDV